MKFAKSLLVLIVAIIASTNAATSTYGSFNVTNSATATCKTLAAAVPVSTCTAACDSVITIAPVTGSTTQFNFNTFALTDTKCAAAADVSTPFTCADSKSVVAIGTTTYSVICIADPEPTPKPDSSSANTLMATSAVLFTALLSALAL